MDILRTTSTMRAFTVHFLVGVSIAMMMAPVTSRMSAPPVAKHHTAGVKHSVSNHCTSRPFLEAEGCGQCSHFLTSEIVRDEDAWLLVIYADRGHVNPHRKLRGRSLRLAPRQLPHQYFIGAMGEALETIADLEPGAKVNIAIFSEGHPGGMVDEHGRPVSWSVAHDHCEHAGLNCLKTEVMLDPSRPMSDTVRCMASADILIGSDDAFSREASALSHNVRVVTSHKGHPEDDEAVVLNVGSAMRRGLSPAEKSELRGVVRHWRECSLEMKELMGLAI